METLIPVPSTIESLKGSVYWMYRYLIARGGDERGRLYDLPAVKSVPGMGVYLPQSFFRGGGCE